MKKNSIYLFILLLLNFSTTVFAQQQDNSAKPRSVGLMASLQPDLAISLPIWVSKKVSVIPAVSVFTAQHVGTDLGFYLKGRYYMKTEKICPYVGIDAGTIINMPYNPHLSGYPV